MGHIAHMRNQFESMNIFARSYDNTYYKTGPVDQEKKIFKFREYTLAILLLSPNVKSVAIPFEQIRILFIQGCFLLNLVEIGPVVLQKKIFNFFHYFVIISPWKKERPFI